MLDNNAILTMTYMRQYLKQLTSIKKYRNKIANEEKLI